MSDVSYLENQPQFWNLPIEVREEGVIRVNYKNKRKHDDTYNSLFGKVHNVVGSYILTKRGFINSKMF